jgi:hypothetical protein
MAGLDPATRAHDTAFAIAGEDMDHRVKPGDDD